MKTDFLFMFLSLAMQFKPVLAHHSPDQSGTPQNSPASSSVVLVLQKCAPHLLNADH